MCDRTEKLCGTAATAEWLEEHLQTAFHTDAKIARLHAEKVGEGQGYISVIVKVTLEWSKHFPRSDEAKNVVIKIPTVAVVSTVNKHKAESYEGDNDHDVDAELTQRMIDRCHKVECAFYDLFKSSPTAPGFNIPQCLAYQLMNEEQFPALIMNDLSLEGYVPRVADGLNLKQVYETVAYFAALQAWSLKDTSWRTKPNLHNDFDLFSKYRPDSIDGVISSGCKELKEKWPQYFNPQIDELTKKYKSIKDITVMYELNKRFSMPDVLCHGDFWTNNIFLRKHTGDNDAEKDDVLALYDWQFVHGGSAAEDIGMTVIASLSPELRRAHELDILQYYYRSLAKRLGGTPPFTIDVFVKAYAAVAQSAALLLLPFIYVVTKDIANTPGGDVAGQRDTVAWRCKCMLDDYVLRSPLERLSTS